MTFIRYVAIGLITYILDVCVFLVFVKLDLLAPVVANALAKVAAGCFSFAAHRAVTFRINTHEGKGGQAFRYFALLALNVPLFSGIFTLVLMYVSEAQSAKILSDIICILLAYAQSKYLVFSHKKQ